MGQLGFLLSRAVVNPRGREQCIVQEHGSTRSFVYLRWSTSPRRGVACLLPTALCPVFYYYFYFMYTDVAMSHKTSNKGLFHDSGHKQTQTTGSWGVVGTICLSLALRVPSPSCLTMGFVPLVRGRLGVGFLSSQRIGFQIAHIGQDEKRKKKNLHGERKGRGQWVRGFSVTRTVAKGRGAAQVGFSLRRWLNRWSKRNCW